MNRLHIAITLTTLLVTLLTVAYTAAARFVLRHGHGRGTELPGWDAGLGLD